MRGKLIVLAVLALVALQIGVARADLVGHWKLDEGSGTVAADATGNGHDGTLNGDPQWVDGYFGGALDLDGQGDEVEVPYSPDLNPEDSFSISAWANLAADGAGHRAVISCRNEPPVAGYIIYATPGQRLGILEQREPLARDSRPQRRAGRMDALGWHVRQRDEEVLCQR